MVEKNEKWTSLKLSNISNFQKWRGAIPNLKRRKARKKVVKTEDLFEMAIEVKPIEKERSTIK